MTDYFAVLGLPRRPGLEETVLQETYLRLAAAWHPDAAGGDLEKFRELQEARQTLLDPASRLRHLLALEGFIKPSDGSFQPSAELFLEVAGALDFVKKVSAKMLAAQSAIARASLSAECVQAGKRLGRVAQRVAERRADLRGQIAAIDAEWGKSSASSLEKIAAEWHFLSRWDEEIQEKRFLLENQPLADLRR